MERKSFAEEISFPRNERRFEPTKYFPPRNSFRDRIYPSPPEIKNRRSSAILYQSTNGRWDVDQRQFGNQKCRCSPNRNWRINPTRDSFPAINSSQAERSRSSPVKASQLIARGKSQISSERTHTTTESISSQFTANSSAKD